jgi:hypothetical protein
MSDRLTTISVDLLPELLNQIDQLTKDRQTAIAEGLKLWIHKQYNQDLQRLAEIHKERHDRDEAGWLI